MGVDAKAVASRISDPLFTDDTDATSAATRLASLRSDEAMRLAYCLTGEWAATFVDFETPEESALSPGDLDEAAQTILDMAAVQRRAGLGFTWVSAFRTGLLGEDCTRSPAT